MEFLFSQGMAVEDVAVGQAILEKFKSKNWLNLQAVNELWCRYNFLGIYKCLICWIKSFQSHFKFITLQMKIQIKKQIQGIHKLFLLDLKLFISVDDIY